MTKGSIPHDRIVQLLEFMGCELSSGRPESAPALRTEGGVKAFSILPDVPLGTERQGEERPSLARGPRGGLEEALLKVCKEAVSEAFLACSEGAVSPGQQQKKEKSSASSRRPADQCTECGIPGVPLGTVGEPPSADPGACKVSWADAASDDEEVSRFVQKRFPLQWARYGPPHLVWDSDAREAVRVPKVCEPGEVPESPDDLIVLGAQIGARGHGRTPLPPRPDVISSPGGGGAVNCIAVRPNDVSL